MVQSVLNGNGAKLTFCFLSDLLGKKIYDNSGELIGKVDDVLAAPNDRRPEIEGVRLSRKGTKSFIPIRSLDLLELARSKRLILTEDRPQDFRPDQRHFGVRDTLYDKQIVDMDGAKVERVNDVRLLSCEDRTYLVYVDVGFTGLVRRLGFEGGVRRMARMFGRQLKDELIGWKFVQPLPETYSGPIHIGLRQEQIRQLHAGELADIIEELDRDERISLVSSISAEDAADALEETDLDVQTSIIRDLDTEIAADILEEMEPAAAVDVIDKLPAEAQQSIMDAMEHEERAQMERLAQAEENTAASLMTVDFISCPETFTAAKALDLIRRNADEVESITYIYCKDDDFHLTGVVSLRDLILSEPGKGLSNTMNRRLATLEPDDDLEKVAAQFLKYRFKALPVVDPENRVQGIVTFMHSFEELLPYYHRLAS